MHYDPVQSKYFPWNGNPSVSQRKYATHPWSHVLHVDTPLYEFHILPAQRFQTKTRVAGDKTLEHDNYEC